MTSPTLPVVEIERRLRWPLWPTVLFMCNLAGLLALAIGSLTLPPAHPQGLPADARLVARARALAGAVPVMTDRFRFAAALLGGEPANRAPDARALALVRAARPDVEAPLRAGVRADARAWAAAAALDMAVHDWPRAAARYRAACERAPHYGEARLGLGVALALEAESTPGYWPRRALRLQAIAQLAAVDPVDPRYPLALYDRALLLAEVDRAREAGYWAERFLARDGASAWAPPMRALAAATR